MINVKNQSDIWTEFGSIIANEISRNNVPRTKN